MGAAFLENKASYLPTLSARKAGITFLEEVFSLLEPGELFQTVMTMSALLQIFSKTYKPVDLAPAHLSASSDTYDFYIYLLNYCDT